MAHSRTGRFVARARVIVTVALVLATSACGDSPTAPSPAPSLTLTAIVPNMGPTDTSVEIRIFGSGFRPGATVTLDGPATNIVVASSTLITATLSPHQAGNVDVVVANPDGRSASLKGGFTFAPLSVSSVSPKQATPGNQITITGTGFLAGATVTIGGSLAAVTNVTPTAIVASFPTDLSGPVDVVVTNPGGQSATLAGAVTALVMTLAASPAVVAPGGPITVTWVAPGRERAFGDWIGMYRVGDQNVDYGWWDYVADIAGTVTATAPMAPGEYEFRYLIDDGYVDIMRSNRVTVRAGG